MNHKGTKTIETERLILRKFTPADAEAMYRNWASDPEATKYLTWQTHSDIKVTKTVIENWVKNYTKANYYLWAIELKGNGGEPVGSIAAVNIEESISAIEIGYCIGRQWWHHGITSEALKAVIDFFFDEVGANRIGAGHDTENPRSGMVMKKCGMKYEGTLRSADLNNQGICDICRYAILKSDRK